jgi:hypothetical protein
MVVIFFRIGDFFPFLFLSLSFTHSSMRVGITYTLPEARQTCSLPSFNVLHKETPGSYIAPVSFPFGAKQRVKVIDQG